MITCKAQCVVTGMPTSLGKQWTPHNAIILITCPAINEFRGADRDEYEKFGTVVSVVTQCGLTDRYSIFLLSPY